jgi:hypothetical protein
MSFTVTLKPAETITISGNPVVLAVRDMFDTKVIIARIKDCPKGIVLWTGEEEYAVAGNWTNESVQARVVEVLSLSAVETRFI